MARYFLGVDVGGTKTHALLATESGEVVGFGQAGTGNHEAVGYDGLAAALRQSAGQALDSAGLSTAQVAGAGFGIAGYDWPSERAPTLEALATLGLTAPVEAVNDATLGLLAGASDGWGLAIDAGTGENVRGRDRQGREGQITGCGSPFGEFGGAGDLVQRAVQMVNYEWIRRGPPTQLTPAFIRRTGATSLPDLIEGLALEYYFLGAGDARLVFEVAEQGDKVAQDAIAWTASELGQAAVGVIRQLDFQDIEFETILIGSLFNGGPLYLDPLRQAIWREAPGARFIPLGAPPAVGGVVLGMQQAGLHRPEVRLRLIETARKFMSE